MVGMKLVPQRSLPFLRFPERKLRYLMALPDPVHIREEVGAEIKIPIYSWAGMRICIARELRRRGLWRDAGILT